MSFLTADGFDKAFLGLSCSQSNREQVAIYDLHKCAKILMDRDEMTQEEALEFLDFNTLGAWLGDTTPIFIETGKIKDFI